MEVFLEVMMVVKPGRSNLKIQTSGKGHGIIPAFLQILKMKIQSMRSMFLFIVAGMEAKLFSL
jgi:hypothetical protein